MYPSGNMSQNVIEWYQYVYVMTLAVNCCLMHCTVGNNTGNKPVSMCQLSTLLWDKTVAGTTPSFHVSRALQKRYRSLQNITIPRSVNVVPIRGPKNLRALLANKARLLPISHGSLRTKKWIAVKDTQDAGCCGC